MSFRVNLLNEEEQRRASPIGRKFAIIAGAVAAAASLLLGAGLFSVRALSSQQKLKTQSARWKQVEPVYKQLKEVQGKVRDRQAMINELAGWSNSRIPAESFLERLQMLTPEQVQLTRLELRGSYGVERKPAASTDRSPPKVWREYRGTISGHAFGEKSEDTAVSFVQALTDDDRLSGDFDSVRLQRLQRAASQVRGQSAAEDLGHIFAIEMSSPPRRFE